MIKATVSGDTEVIAKLDRIGVNLKVEMRSGIGRLAKMLQTSVKEDKLSGQVLNVRSGRLRRSIAEIVEDEGDQVVGIVSTPVKYGRIHEYGFAGTEQVKEYMRRAKGELKGKGRLQKGGGSIVVQAHSRKVNLPERSFLRSALRDLDESGRIKAEMEEAVKRAKT